MPIGLMKTLNEFEDGPSGTPLRPLKTLTSKNNNSLRMKVRISKFEMLIGVINTADDSEEEPPETYLRVWALKTFTFIKLVNKITPEE